MAEEVFDHPFQIDWYRVTARGKYVNGVWTPETSVSTQIKGSYVPGPQEVSEITGQGTRLEEGEALIYTTSALNVNDKLRIHHDTSGTNYTKYRVIGISERYDWWAKMSGEVNRNGFMLVREEN